MARICVVGGGLAGSLLAWRLAHHDSGDEVELVRGVDCRADATAASGGAVRAYERHPEQRRLAIESMVELLSSTTLQRWAGYQPLSAVSLPVPADEPALAEINQALPDSATLLTAADLTAAGFAGLPAGTVALQERQAGYLSPDRLREAVVADCVGLRRVRLCTAELSAITLRADGTVDYLTAGQWHTCDRLVFAAGAWTARLLTRLGLPADGYRTKSIQYVIHQTDGWRPPQFVDETIGLYGRPDGADGLLLGCPTEQWGVDPSRPSVTAHLNQAAARLASDRFPALRLGPVTRTVSAVDCYAPQPILRLRPVEGTSQLFTFTGGAGGSVKTVLAASRAAATELTESGEVPASTPVGPREGTP